MAKDSQGNLFVALTGSMGLMDIYRIDLVMVQMQFVARTTLNDLRGLTFDSNDTLYGLHDTTFPIGGGPDDLYTIDLATGACTRIGATGMNYLQALTYGAGKLWGWDYTGAGLVMLDIATGLAADVNPHLNDPPLGLFQTLCFSDNGILYGADGLLCTVDPVTGAASYVGLIDQGFALLGGMEFLPNQPDPFALWVQGKTGGPMAVQIAGATPGAAVAILAASGAGGPITVPAGTPCAGLQVDLNGTTRLLGIVTADGQGRASLGPAQVPAAARDRARLQAVDLAACATSNRVQIKY